MDHVKNWEMTTVQRATVSSQVLTQRSWHEVRDMFMSVSVSRFECLLWLRIWTSAHLCLQEAVALRWTFSCFHERESNRPREDAFHPDPPWLYRHLIKQTWRNGEWERAGRVQPQYDQLNREIVEQALVLQGSSLGNPLKESVFWRTVLRRVQHPFP